MFQHLRQARDAQPERLARIHLRERIASRRDRALHGMRDGINAGASRDPVRLRKGQPRVEDGDAGGCLRVEAGHLHVRLLVRDERGGLTFTPRARGGGNRDEGQHRLLRLAHAPVVLHPPAVGEDEVAALRRVHRAAPAQADEQVHLLRRGDGHALIHALRRGILLGPVEETHVQAGLGQRLLHMSRVPGLHDARVRDEQDAPPAEFPRQLADLRDCARAEHEPRAGNKIKQPSGGGSVASGNHARKETGP